MSTVSDGFFNIFTNVIHISWLPPGLQSEDPLNTECILGIPSVFFITCTTFTVRHVFNNTHESAVTHSQKSENSNDEFSQQPASLQMHIHIYFTPLNA